MVPESEKRSEPFSYALADTLANLGPDETPALLELLDDIDDKAAYQRWRGRHPNQPA